MGRKYRVVALGPMLFTLLLLMACSSQQGSQDVAASASERDAPGPAPAKPRPKLYTAYNLWCEKPARMYCVNYCRGRLIPAGTRVSDVRLVRKAFKKRQGIEFKPVESGVPHVIFFAPEFHPGMTIEQFRDRLFTSKTFEELTAGLTEEEIAYVRKGALAEGMSKQAVLVSRGYPPEHVTPTLKANSWTYWMSRFNRTVAHFADDRVRLVQE